MRLSDTEWSVMRVIWEAGSATARDVCEAVKAERGWAYTTVKTLCDRLVQKGALRAARHDRTHVYTATLSEHDARAAALQAVADHAFDGGFAPMLRFLAAEKPLGAKERRALQDLLDRESKR